MDIREGKLWVTEAFLTEELPIAPWCISSVTVRMGTMRFRRQQSTLWENYPHIKLKRKVLISLESIDFDTINPFKNGLFNAPSISEILNQYKSFLTTRKQEYDLQLVDELEERWMAYYKGLDERYYQQEWQVNKARGEQKANHLAQSIAILRLLHSGDLCGFSSKKDLQQAVATKVSELNLYGKGLSSYSRLRTTLASYRKALNDPDTDEREVVVSNHHGNQRRLKFDLDHRAAALRYYLDGKKPDKYSSWLDYVNFMRLEAETSKEDCIQYKRFCQITQEKEVIDMAAMKRHGGAEYHAYIAPFVLRKPFQFSLTLVAGDGWEPGRSVKFKWWNPNKKRFEQRTGTMSVWLWYDVKTKFILSHNVAPFENSYQIRMSFRDIIHMWGECPTSAMVDKKWMNQEHTKRMFEKADVFLQPKKAYSPWTNPAERNNKENNKIHRYLDDYWVNMTQNHSQQSRHNEEHVRGASSMSESDFRAMVYEIIERYNSQILKSLGGKTPQEAFLSSERDPHCKAFNPLDLTWIFGEKTVSTVRNYNVEITVATKTYLFCVAPEDIRAFQQASPHKNKVRVYYDERHMDTADLYAFSDEKDESGDVYICTAINADKIRVSGSTLERSRDPEHDAKLGWQQKRKATLDEIIEERIEELQQVEDSIGWNTAAFMNASQQRYKEAHSNEVAKQYRDYHQDREDFEGHRVTVDKKGVPQVMDSDQEFEIMRQKMQELNQESLNQ